MLQVVQTACQVYNVRSVDLWTNLLVRVAAAPQFMVSHS